MLSLKDEEAERAQAIVEEDKDFAVEVSRQVRELFYRLDVPLDTVPLGSMLPWQSFESLLVNHVRQKRQQPNRQTRSPQRAATPLPSRGKARNVPLQDVDGDKASSLSPLSRNRGQHGAATPKSTSHVSFVSGVPADTHSRPHSHQHSHHHSGHGASGSRHSNHESSMATATAQPHSDDSVLFDASKHSLSLMLSNDSTHIPTMETTLHDMKVALRRMDGMSVALSQGRPFRAKSDTSIEQGVIYDPELRTINELRRSVEVLRSDLATNQITIHRLEEDVADKKAVIAHLRRALAKYRKADPFGGAEDEDDDDEEEESHLTDGVSENPPSSGVETAAVPSTAELPFTNDSFLSEPTSGAGSIRPALGAETSPTVNQAVSPQNGSITTDGGREEAGKVGGREGAAKRFQNALAALRSSSPAARAKPTFSNVVSAAVSASKASNPSSLRARLSISTVVAFRELVLDHLPRRHAVYGLELFDAMKRIALYEAALVNRLMDRVRSLEAPNNRRASATAMVFSTSGSSDGSEHTHRSEDLDAYEFFAMSPLRLLMPPQYAGPRVQPFGDTLCFLAISVSNGDFIKESLGEETYASAISLAGGFVESMIRSVKGHIIFGEQMNYLAVFESPARMMECALELQVDLANTPSITWPPGLDKHPLLATSRDVHSTVKRFVWRGLRLGMCAEMIPAGPSSSCWQDVVDPGAAIYNHPDLRTCQWMAAHAALPGSIVMTERAALHVERDMVELDDPLLGFWSWVFTPGASTPTKYFDLYHRFHASRRAENQHTMRQLYQPAQLRLLTDPTAPATLERLVASHNAQAAKLGMKPQTRDDESILGLEGTVEQRLAQLRTLPDVTSEEIRRPPHEDVFLAHVAASAAPGPTPPDNWNRIPSGDVCTILVSIPAYDAVVRMLDDVMASSFSRRIFRVCKELAKRQEFGGIHFIRGSRDRLLFATPDPIEGIRYAVALQDQLFHLAPWPKDSNLPPPLLAMLEAKKVRKRVVAEGPAVNCALHFSKVRLCQDQYGLQQLFYVGSELDILETMSFNAPENCNSIMISDTLFSIYFLRESELPGAQPFIECIGTIDRWNELRCVYALTPRSLVGRILLFPPALWSGYRRWAQRNHSASLNSGLPSRREVDACLPGSGIEQGIFRYSPVSLSPSERKGMLRYYRSCEATHRARQLRPAHETLANSNTITSTKTQTMCAKLFFEGSRKMARASQTLSVVASIARHRGRSEDYFVAERVEISVMELHDALLPPVARGRMTVHFDATGLQDCGIGVGGVNSALAHAQPSSTSSTPRSTHLISRTGSGRNLLPDSARGRLNLGASATSDTHHGHGGVGHPAQGAHAALPPGGVPDDASSSASPRQNGGDGHTHEVRALLDIDKERQYIVQRSRKIEAEVLITHHAMQFFMQMVESYLSPLLSTKTHRISDEEVIWKCMSKLNALRSEAKRKEENGSGSDEDSLDDDDAPTAKVRSLAGDKSSSDDEGDEGETSRMKPQRPKDREEAFNAALERIQVNERWRDCLASVVELHDGGQVSDYDPVLLCRSMVGSMCRHFLSLRTIQRRLTRTHESLERAQRTIDPTTRIGKAVVAVTERDLEQRHEEENASRAVASKIIQLGAVDGEPQDGADESASSPIKFS